GKWKPGQQRRDRVASRPASAFEHEPAAGECPRADGRALRTPDGPGKISDVRRDSCDLGDRAPDGKAELRARSKSSVLGQIALDLQMNPGLQPVVCEKGSREFLGAPRRVTFNDERGSRSSGKAKRRT